jgi:hypothetical protein
MGWTCVISWRDEIVLNLVRKPEGKRSLGRSKHKQIDIKTNLMKGLGGCGLDSSGSILGPVAGFFNVVRNVVFKHPAAPL